MNGIDRDVMAFNANQVEQLSREFLANCKQIDSAIMDVFRIGGGLSYYDKERGDVIVASARAMLDALSLMRVERRQFIKAVMDMQFHMNEKREVA